MEKKKRCKNKKLTRIKETKRKKKKKKKKKNGQTAVVHIRRREAHMILYYYSVPTKFTFVRGTPGGTVFIESVFVSFTCALYARARSHRTHDPVKPASCFNSLYDQSGLYTYTFVRR